MTRILPITLCAVLMSAPAFAITPVPAPILGAGLPALGALGLAAGGYLLLRWRRGGK